MSDHPDQAFPHQFSNPSLSKNFISYGNSPGEVVSFYSTMDERSNGPKMEGNGRANGVGIFQECLNFFSCMGLAAT